ncbi:MAG: AbrB/MazE/SpoVT family DNA-binding domain-containing protein [Patescibacteria group bacterium]
MFGISTLTSKGQATIPEPLRSFLGLTAGDKVLFEADAKEKFLRVKPASATSIVDETFGSLPSKFGYVDIKTVREVAGKRLGEKYAVKTK